jgi:hypothetical protein
MCWAGPAYEAAGLSLGWNQTIVQWANFRRYWTWRRGDNAEVVRGTGSNPIGLAAYQVDPRGG